MNRFIWTIGGSLLMLLSSLAAGGEAKVKFSSKPSAVKDKHKVVIAFAVSGKTDIEVAVLDAKGKVVRHLAAGVLGAKKNPPPPLKAGLSQKLEWNGLDDFAKKAIGGPFKVRVRAGIAAKFGRLIGEDPYTFGSMVGVTCDESGNVYVMGRRGTHNQSSRTLRVFDPEGQYLRELVPFPASLAPGSMKDVAKWDPVAKRWHPRNTSCLVPEFYTSGGKLISASTKNGLLLGDSVNLYQLKPDGSVSGEKFCTKRLMWEKKYHHWGGIAASGKGCMAASPDGKYLYLSGIAYTRAKFKNLLVQGRVYRLELNKPGATMQPFVTIDVSKGNWKKGGADTGEGKSATHGVDVDSKGRVYICNRENDSIQVFDQSGKKLFAVPVANPDCVDVIGDGSLMYVIRRKRLGYYRHEVELMKFVKPSPSAKPAALFKLPSTINPGLAVSMRKGKATIWVSGLKTGLKAFSDAGASFSAKDTQFRPRKDGQVDWNRLAVDYDRDELYVADGGNKIWRYDGKTGAGGILRKGKKPLAAVDLAVGYNGLLYIRTGPSFSGPLERFTRDLKPAPFAGGSHVLSPYIYSRYGIGNCEKGIGVGPKGECYISFMYTWVGYGIGGFGPDGKGLAGSYLKGKFPAMKPGEKKKYTNSLDGAIVGPITDQGGGIRVDLQGNIYVGMAVRASNQPITSAYAKDRIYSAWTGSVVKFSPKGGAVLGIKNSESKKPDAPRIELIPAKGKKLMAEGALNTYYGLGPFSGSGPGGNSSGCVCRVARFDVDRYGRVSMPSAFGPTTMFYDNAGNLIAEIGRYGNFDSQYVAAESTDKKPIVAVPAIPVAWPSGTGFSENHLYINDTTNRRAVRVDWTHAAEETCQVK
jgi:hypothetical protein